MFQHLRALQGEVDCGNAACDAHRHDKPTCVAKPAKQKAKKKAKR